MPGPQIRREREPADELGDAFRANWMPRWRSAVQVDKVPLGKVVVYRNGVAFYERRAQVKDGKLTVSVPRDRVDDFLKSLTVVDAKTGETVAERYALFLEAESDLARRMEGRIAELPRAVFADLDPATLHRMMLFAYMIGNTDFSIFALHNVRLVQDQKRQLYPVPYDFDYSGLVDAPYAVPARVLGLKTVQERAYRGPCLTIDELEKVAAGFREKKAEMLALVESVPGLDAGSRRHMRRYLEEFFKAIADRGTLKHELVDGCSKKKGM